jgi:hypothetical protein
VTVGWVATITVCIGLTWFWGHVLDRLHERRTQILAAHRRRLRASAPSGTHPYDRR